MLEPFSILLTVVAIGVSIWPPHRHRYTFPTDEIYLRSEHLFEVRRCACGKTRDYVTYTGEHFT